MSAASEGLTELIFYFRSAKMQASQVTSSKKDTAQLSGVFINIPDLITSTENGTTHMVVPFLYVLQYEGKSGFYSLVANGCSVTIKMIFF